MQHSKIRQTNAERRAATRSALLASARHLFTQKGYADTTTPEIVADAKITRGALYHHYRDKEDLFRAVTLAEFQAVAKEIEDRTAGSQSPFAALSAGAAAFIRAMQKPGRARIMLLDGPAVLGRAEIDRMDRETSAATLRSGLQAAMDTGEIRTLPIDALTSQLSAMFDRAALEIIDGGDAEAHLAVISELLHALKKRPAP